MATIVIAGVIAVLFVLAVRHTHKTGGCACADKCEGCAGACPHKTAQQK